MSIILCGNFIALAFWYARRALQCARAGLASLAASFECDAARAFTLGFGGAW
jgi:hypothetical protein